MLADGGYANSVASSLISWDRDALNVVVEIVKRTDDAKGSTVYRLVTTLLDPDTAPAAEVAALYAQRWEIESTLDEIKTHLGGPRLVLRSQHPAGAEQEIFAFLLVHHAVRDLCHEAARQERRDPDRISFTRAVRVVRRQVTAQAALSPLTTHTGLAQTLLELGQRLLEPQRLRSNPRVIKRKMSNWALKRTEHNNQPRPDTPVITLAGPTKPTPTSRKKT